MNKIIILLCLSFAFVLSFPQTGRAQNETQQEEMLDFSDTTFSANAISSENNAETLDESSLYTPTNMYLLPDDPIAAMLDSMSQQKYLGTFNFTTDKNILNVYNYNETDVPFFSDSILEERIKKLNQVTPMELTYNAIVARYIDLYANRKRELTAKMLGLSEIYFPMFEEMLDKYDVPLEMKYLAIVESALNPTATSRAGAKGLWQFMYATGKMYGLEVNSIIDNRNDPYKSTDAACRHLKDLYKMYNNWELALAAYNCGAGNVNKAIRRSGGKTNYWQLWPYLPTETRGYVPAFIAVVYIMNYASEHNIYPLEPGIFAHQIDTVSVTHPLVFDQITETLGVPFDLVSFLNPMYKKGVIPASKYEPYALRLPTQYAGLFIMNEDSIYAYKTQKSINKENLMADIKNMESQEMKYHKVKRGETLSLIASKYRCSVSNLRSWNGLKQNAILKIGQNLIVYSSSSQKAASNTVSTKRTNASVSTNTTATKTTIASSTGSRATYKVKKGDTLWSISKKYPGITPDDIRSYNGMNSSNLKIGQTLKIPQ